MIFRLKNKNKKKWLFKKEDDVWKMEIFTFESQGYGHEPNNSA